MSVPTERKIRVLLTNDDGPPSRDSPFILGLYLKLIAAGYDVKVVIPSSQNSWIGKAYRIKDKIFGRYYYPRERGALKPESTEVSRPLKDGELGEWILLDGTPATCANIALHNLYPGEIDLVISGPNLGRNTSSAPPEWVDPSHDLAIRIVDKLWKNWGHDPTSPRNGEIELYNVNIPLVRELLNEGSLEVVWTRIWRNHYGSLFQHSKPNVEISPAGPDAPPSPSTEAPPGAEPTLSPRPTSAPPPLISASSLTFHFAPQMGALVNPPLDSLPFGTDAWAVHNAKASVTPLRTSFAEPDEESYSDFFNPESTNAPVSNGRSTGTEVGAAKVESFVGRPWKL